MNEKEIPLKYRARCPNCGKAFDIRKGVRDPQGRLSCNDCVSKMKYATYINQ